MAFLANKEIEGAINGSSSGTISIREIIDYVEKKTGSKAIISEDGEDAPYNGEPAYSINTDKALALGFKFPQYYAKGELLIYSNPSSALLQPLPHYLLKYLPKLL